MTIELSAREFERRFQALAAQALSPSLGRNEGCMECQRCKSCSGCTFCTDSERLVRCHFCVGCHSCTESLHCRASKNLVGCQDCVDCNGCSPYDRKTYFELTQQLSRELGS